MVVTVDVFAATGAACRKANCNRFRRGSVSERGLEI